jgi:hypothetical protein
MDETQRVRGALGRGHSLMAQTARPLCAIAGCERWGSERIAGTWLCLWHARELSAHNPSSPGTMTRRGALRLMAVGGSLLGLAAAGCGGRGTPNMMRDGMMGSASGADMSTYMELFARHSEIRRTVEKIPGGVRTITESDAPELAAQLQAHVASMFEHLDRRAEVTCMSRSLPTLFRNASGYQRRLTTTHKGLVVTETSADTRLVQAIREHAHEVTGFVREGMKAMMQGMMG